MSTRVLFEHACRLCPGDGVIRPKRRGVDWPTPCPCEARGQFTQYQLGRLLEEQPRTVVRVNNCRSSSDVSFRILGKIAAVFPEALR